MTLGPEPTEVPTDLGDIAYQFTEIVTEGDDPIYPAQADIQILDQNGNVLRVRSVPNMIPFMLQSEIDTMLALYTTWRARAKAILIGG